jgi:hypothetical protein
MTDKGCIPYKEMKKHGLTKPQMKILQKQCKSQYINNAWHESAHVVVGMVLGLDTDFIDLTPHIQELYNGGVMLTAAQTHQRQLTRLECIAALDGDNKIIDLFERCLVAGMGGVVYDLWNGSFGGGMDLWDAIARCINLFKGDVDKCNAMINAGAITAARILDDYSGHLTAMATTAIELQMVDKSEIDATMKLKLDCVPMGFLEHGDVNLVFEISKGLDPRCQIGLIGDFPAGENMDVNAFPPYDILVKLDESMINEIVNRFEAA